MTECTNGELRDLLPELVNGRLDAETGQRVEAHLASCEVCADELVLLRSLRPALMRAPAIDAERIAAAVRAQTAAGASSATTRAGIARRWKVAIAASALLAAGALGYVARVHRGPGTPEVAATPAPPGGARKTGTPPQKAPESAHAPIPASPQVAVAPPHLTAPMPTAPTSLASTAVLDNVSDLSDDEVRTLTASLDKLSAVPDADPSPGIDPLGASLDDLSVGGR
jgi:anti-sigma factor RsiW